MQSANGTGSQLMQLRNSSDTYLTPMAYHSGNLSATWTLDTRNASDVLKRMDSQCYAQSVDPFLAAYRFAINVGILGVISVMAIIGNAITFVVLKTDKSSTYKGSSSSTSLILLSLAVCDALFALSSVLVQLLPTMLHHLQVGVQVSNMEARVFPYAFYFGSAVRMMRNWTIVLVSIERWIAIFKPLHAQVICTVRKAKIAVTCIVLIAASYNVPRFIEAMPMEINCGNYTRLVYTRSPLRANWAYQYVYMISLYMVFVIAGPMLVLTVLNFLLMRAIRQVAVQRERLMETSRPLVKCKEPKGRNGNCLPSAEGVSHTQQSDSEAPAHAATAKGRSATQRNKFKTKTEITRMCVGIIMLYIICELPALIYQIMFYLKVSRSVTVYIQPISNGLVALNSALNFFVYVFLGKRFRKRVKELFHCSVKQADARRSSVMRLKLQNATSRTTQTQSLTQTLTVVPSRLQTHVAFDDTSLGQSQA